MAGNQTNTAQITVLSIEDTTNNVLVNRSFAPSLDAKMGQYGTYNLANATGDITLFLGAFAMTNLPAGITILYNVYVRNLAAPGGANMRLNVVTGVNANIVSHDLQPGDVFLYWSNNNSGIVATAGITSLVVPHVAAYTAPFEYFIGG